MFSLFMDTREVLNFLNGYLGLWMDIKEMFIYVWMLGMFYLSMDGYIRDVYLCFNAKDVLSIYGWIHKRCLSMIEF